MTFFFNKMYSLQSNPVAVLGVVLLISELSYSLLIAQKYETTTHKKGRKHISRFSYIYNFEKK